MVAYITRRLILVVIVIFIVTFLTFLLMHITPGDPVLIMVGMEAHPEQIERIRHDLGLDLPFIVQYGHWLNKLVHGDLGHSIRYHQPVADLLLTRLPITLYLSALAWGFALIVGLSGGIISSVKRGSWIDSVINVIANMGVGIPIFWLGILMIYLFGLRLQWLPIEGYTAPWVDFWLSIRRSILPVLVMSVIPLAIFTRQSRSSMLEAINQDYVRTARAKGLRERVVMLKHALRNALIPIVTLLGLQTRWIVAGSVIAETIFNIPGIGRLLVTSVLQRDYIVVQVLVLIIALSVAVANLVVDISYGWLDPRVRYR